METLADITQEIATCSACALCVGATNPVPGEGSPTAKVMLIGEAPGANEDRLGRPFVGRAGEKLDEMISAMGLLRQ